MYLSFLSTLSTRVLMVSQLQLIDAYSGVERRWTRHHIIRNRLFLLDMLAIVVHFHLARLGHHVILASPNEINCISNMTLT